MRNLFHVGLHKTATTLLQEHVFKHASSHIYIGKTRESTPDSSALGNAVTRFAILSSRVESNLETEFVSSLPSQFFVKYLAVALSTVGL